MRLQQTAGTRAEDIGDGDGPDATALPHDRVSVALAELAEECQRLRDMDVPPSDRLLDEIRSAMSTGVSLDDVIKQMSGRYRRHPA